MSDRSIYIAGPMRGYPEFNFPKFNEAAASYERDGWHVYSPADHDFENGFDPTGLTGDEALEDLGFDLKEALTWDVNAVIEADAIALLPGWEDSKGARAEYALAQALDKDVYFYEEEEPPAALTDLLRKTAEAHVEMQTYATGRLLDGEVRITNALTGGEKGSKLARFDLIRPETLKELAEHNGVGALKYADRNWEKGYDWSLSFAALNRHLWAFWGGEDIDEETGSKHIIAAAWHCFVLARFMDTHPELDTRGIGKD